MTTNPTDLLRLLVTLTHRDNYSMELTFAFCDGGVVIERDRHKLNDPEKSLDSALSKAVSNTLNSIQARVKVARLDAERYMTEASKLEALINNIPAELRQTLAQTIPEAPARRGNGESRRGRRKPEVEP